MHLPDQRIDFNERKLDKQKYLDIVKANGLHAALTELHRDKEQLEFVTFEGEKGYQPQLWAMVQEYCEFSRELWNTQLK